MIDIQDLTFSYSTLANSVFEHLTTQFEAGHIYGLLGKNGVGKSTLFRLISGINRPSCGSISAFGFRPQDRLPAMYDQIALLPETFDCPHLSFRKYAERYGRFHSGFSASDLSEFARIFEIEPDQQLIGMSQGQRKKAMIAYTLSLNTSVILMDEPTNGLDIPSKQMFRRSLQKVQSPDRVIIISTHQVRDLEELIDAVAVVHDRNVVLNRTCASLLEQYRFGNVNSGDDIVFAVEVGESRSVGMTRLGKDESPSDRIDLEILFGAAIARALS